jgi:signal transduction histidine kinase
MGIMNKERGFLGGVFIVALIMTFFGASKIIELNKNAPWSLTLFLITFMITGVFIFISIIIAGIANSYLARLGVYLWKNNSQVLTKLSSQIGLKIQKVPPYLSFNLSRAFFKNLCSIFFGKSPEAVSFLSRLGNSKDKEQAELARKSSFFLSAYYKVWFFCAILFALTILSVIVLTVHSVTIGMDPCVFKGPIAHEKGIPEHCQETFEGYYYDPQSQSCVHYKGRECRGLPFSDLQSCDNACKK